MLDTEHRALIGISSTTEVFLNPAMANRHGLITGATGTGKTVSLQVLAETFSQMGVPVFAADAKGDLSGVAASGGNKNSVTKRVDAYGLLAKGFSYQAYPVQFWDVFGEQGAPVRATVAGMGPLLLSRLLSLNDTQTAVLTVIFTIARDESLELLDLKDLRKLLEHVAANAQGYSGKYGNLATASIGAIQRNLVALEHGQAGRFFGEPSLAIADLMRAEGGKGVVNILASDKLMQSPEAYTSFLLWFMNELFTTLPEVGDPEKPKLVFFFDEAHLLFNSIPKALLEKVEQVVRLIRSKGVGIYFISQTPADMPDSVLGQLGNRIQHALRAYTPKDRNALKAAAMSFRPNPAFDTETAISELETGEALISLLDEKGAPQPVQRAFILPPQSHIGPLDEEERARMMQSSPLQKIYGTTADRVSAFEVLEQRSNTRLSDKEKAAQQKEEEKKCKEEEKLLRDQQKAEQKESAQRRKFWTGVARDIVVPFLRKSLQSLIKK